LIERRLTSSSPHLRIAHSENIMNETNNLITLLPRKPL
jgi:hypothetical protein